MSQYYSSFLYVYVIYATGSIKLGTIFNKAQIVRKHVI